MHVLKLSLWKSKTKEKLLSITPTHKEGVASIELECL